MSKFEIVYLSARLAESESTPSDRWTMDDGGRKAAGYVGSAGDCVTRSIAIATGKSYQEVYDAINESAQEARSGSYASRSNARTGVFRKTYQSYLESLGWVWYPTMHVGSGCTVHLKKEELPRGRLLVKVSKHLTCVIDGLIHDTHDPSREGTRCVYGYFMKG